MKLLAKIYEEEGSIRTGWNSIKVKLTLNEGSEIHVGYVRESQNGEK